MNKPIYIVLIFTLFLFAMTVYGLADTDILSTFEIEGADFTYDIETGNIVSHGVLILKSKEFYIEAKDVVFDTENQVLQGKDKIKLKIENTNIEGIGISIDFKKGVAEVQKDVKVWGMEEENKWRIKGKSLNVNFVLKEDIRKIKDLIVVGDVQFFYNDLSGEADSIKYLPSEKKVFLEGNVSIKKGKNTIIASNITIDLETKKVITKGKVKIIVNNK